jgi:hypothetical protein
MVQDWLDYLVIRYADDVTFTHDQMRAAAFPPDALRSGASPMPFPSRRTSKRHEQTVRAHAMGHALPELVLQLPLEAA